MQDLTIAAIQTHLHWWDASANHAHFATLFDQIKDADLVLLPEMFNTGFSMEAEDISEPMSGPTIAWMTEQAARIDRVICGTLAIEENGNFYNRLIWMRPDGSFEAYDKRHLFRMADEHLRFKGGEERLIVELNGWRICPLTCYDLRFPVWSRNIDQDYDVLMYLANWPGVRRHAWNSLATARAIENLSYVVAVNRIGDDGNGIGYTGDSAIYDMKGQPMALAEDRDAILEVTLSKAKLTAFREKFPAHRDADSFTI